MIERHHEADGIRSSALWSVCGAYRYRLSRRWAEGPQLLYIMLNPSRATEAQNDPTIERCQRRATALGYGAFTACNLFSLCATDPRDLKAHTYPDTPDHDQVLRAAAGEADTILCAWGVHGTHRNRANEVAALLHGLPLFCLGTTQAGHPRHPLYVPYATRPTRWQIPS